MKSSHAGSSHSDLLNWAPSSLKKSVELASEKDASSWLTVLLDRNIGMVLLYIRPGFHDAITLRHGGCQHFLCGARFTTEHVQKEAFFDMT